METKVWYTDSFNGGILVRFTKGEAIEDGHTGWSPEGTLHYCGDLAEILKNTSTVYRYAVGDLCSHFYFDEEEAWKAVAESFYDGLSKDNLQVCDIVPKKYEPVKLPCHVLLEEGNRGLLCRMNLHPEETGMKSGWKLYFPDRDCKEELCAGPAIITEVKEKSTYGFFKARMVQYEAPSDEEVSQYIIKHNMYDRDVRFCSNKFGNFVLLDELRLVKKDGEVSICNIRPDVYDNNVIVSKVIKSCDLVSQGYQGCSVDELIAKFGQFMFDGYGSKRSTRFISILFDEAISSGFINLRTIHNVEFVEVNREALEYNLNQYSPEEMSEIAAVCADLNEKANQAIKSKIKSGKIHLNIKPQHRGYHW